jgi:hypothetical protein
MSAVVPLDIIAQARALLRLSSNEPDSRMSDMLRAVCEIAEKHAARIAELEDLKHDLLENNNSKMQRIWKAEARIQDLEAERDSWRDKALSCPYNR